MGFGTFPSSILVLTLFFFRPTLSQQPNTDGFFVSDFMKKMGVVSLYNFNFSSPVCSWQGVFCDAQHENVIGLVASGLSLSGFIPDTTIGKLNKLQSLDLSNNNITGFSSDFWSLGKSLKTLNLSCNHVFGILPNNIGNFDVLESLDLSFNNFSGEIPASFSALLSVQVLKIDRNQFVGSIPLGILSCQNLVSFDVSSNLLNGTFPVGFGAAFPKLKILNLAGNEIHGRSSQFSGLKSITHLNISRNSFHGSLMHVFQGQLEVADLSHNHFQGHVSQVHFKFNFNWSLLHFLDLSSNNLVGEFFHDLSEAQNLRHLNLANNRFSGQHFPRILKLSSLEYLNLSQTNISGDIPTEISKLGSLRTLDLSMNSLSGRIPYLGTNSLQVLDLSCNNLTGEVPFSLLSKLPQMKRFNFSYNNLTLCASNLSGKTFKTAFIGSLNSCPIAANPDLFKRKMAKHNGGLKLYLAVTLSLFCFLMGLLCLVFGCRRKNTMWEAKLLRPREEKNISGPFSFETDSASWVADVKLATSVPVVIFEKPLLNLTFADILFATSHFDRETLIAEGRFGPVYRGILPGGMHVALKALLHVSTMTDKEVAKELEHLACIKHPNLVPLIGYCLAGDQRISIYNYMENGNLQILLHGVQPIEDWSTNIWEENTNSGAQNVGLEELLKTWRFRHKLALGIARALAFLHHGCSPSIIHRDVKASSIHLDSNLDPRLSGFGLFSGLEDHNAHGSPGYVPPEVVQPISGPPTLKSDVYGFGVVLFELITGKKPLDDDYQDEKVVNLVSWARGLVRRNQCAIAIDPKIQRMGSDTQIEEALRIGYLCTADLPTKRPSMHQIVGLLKDVEPVADQ